MSELRAFHRATYMAERRVYYTKIIKAGLEKSKYISNIWDGMAESHCELPWLSNLANNPKTLTQHLQGNITHGDVFVSSLWLTTLFACNNCDHNLSLYVR